MCTHIYCNGWPLVLIWGEKCNSPSHYNGWRSGQESWFLINAQGQTHHAAIDKMQLSSCVWQLCEAVASLPCQLPMTQHWMDAYHNIYLLQSFYYLHIARSLQTLKTHQQCPWFHHQNKNDGLVSLKLWLAERYRLRRKILCLLWHVKINTHK